MSSNVADNVSNISVAPVGAVTNDDNGFPDTVIQIPSEENPLNNNRYVIPLNEVRDVIIQDMYDSLLTVLKQHTHVATQIGITVTDVSEVLGKAVAKALYEIRDVNKIKSKYDTMVYFHDINKALSEGFSEEKNRVLLNLDIK